MNSIRRVEKPFTKRYSSKFAVQRVRPRKRFILVVTAAAAEYDARDRRNANGSRDLVYDCPTRL